MIKIAICDDEEKERNIAIELCNQFGAIHTEYDIRICPYASSKELMKDFMQKEQPDIVLLDIYMPEMTGMELARHLREKNNDLQMVFLTTSKAHAVEAFSLHAAHYLVKPYTAAQLEDALLKAVGAVEKSRSAQLVLKTSEGVQKVSFSELLYSETERHVQKIHLISGECLPVRITCNELSGLLQSDSRFYRCGSTYIINLAKIKEITVQNIIFDNGMQIPMQRRQYRELLDRYTGYALEGN